jgi:hypothetical protein
MIATELIEEIRRLLQAGRISQRQIAERLGVSRATVNAIACGRHRTAANQRRGREADAFIPPTGLPTRCPNCGGLTQMPCLACYIRAKQQAGRTARPPLGRRPIRGNTVIASCG